MTKGTTPVEGDMSPLTATPTPPPPPGSVPRVRPAPTGGGAAPWERAGAAAGAPGTAASAEATERYRRLEAATAAAAAAAAEAAAAERAAAVVAAEAMRQAELERTARVMFWVGAAGVPLMFPVAVMYFWAEARDPSASKVIRGCTLGEGGAGGELLVGGGAGGGDGRDVGGGAAWRDSGRIWGRAVRERRVLDEGRGGQFHEGNDQARRAALASCERVRGTCGWRPCDWQRMYSLFGWALVTRGCWTSRW